MATGNKFTCIDGYVMVNVGRGHHLAGYGGYVPEHRLVAEGILGRRIRKEETVHHLNGDKADNRPENLHICANAKEHRSFHTKEKRRANA